MKKSLIILPLAAAVAACGSDGGSSALNQIKVVGSSTVYPFTTAVAESFQRANPGTSVIVESTGTGSGMKLFCAGVGEEHPDIVNASRRMKKSEFDMCAEAGVNNVIEVAVGIDGLTLIQAKGADPIDLTVEDIYAALAKDPYGGEQTAQNWSDVREGLPNIPIRVYGPPPTSGTRDSFAELILEAGCASNDDMKALKESDKKAYEATCHTIREDGVFIEAGENDNLLVQKVSADDGMLGVLGYSFLEANSDKVQPVSIGGAMPNTETISSLEYPGARKLFIYVKGEHVEVKPAIRDFLNLYAQSWGSGGMLEQRGLVPLAGDDAAASNDAATNLTTLDGSEL
ncbi:substrate-binding domain-containing protein [Sphingomicrobium clamense]|uniref:Substrate-binding domain-containing protein n=1 Tax=Sphingomicrobium clamense TaxID=2851013 RepID=A0ABS6V441_9SPHN|nr:substrate-binding domain-containing protein [Sphingomicrobium sp. B8]MBW0144325.1 substrate-binding domain-containing protein [Sphingomicrobium sp. B8]